VATETVPLGAGASTITQSYDVAARRSQMQVSGQPAVPYGQGDANRLALIIRHVRAAHIDFGWANGENGRSHFSSLRGHAESGIQSGIQIGTSDRERSEP